MGPRIGEKVIFNFIIMTLYWGIGSNTLVTNIGNISACLAMWWVACFGYKPLFFGAMDPLGNTSAFLTTWGDASIGYILSLLVPPDS